MPEKLVGTRAGTTCTIRTRTPKDFILADGSKTRLTEEELLAVVKGLDLLTRNRLHHLAKALGLDEESTLVWLNEKTAGTYPKGSESEVGETRWLSARRITPSGQWRFHEHSRGRSWPPR